MLEVDEGDPFNKLLHAKSINNLRARNIFAKVSTEIKERYCKWREQVLEIYFK